MPDTGLSRPQIVNWALAELGLAPTFSIDEATDRGNIVSLFWPRVVAQTFSLTDWTFFRRTSRLTRRAEPLDTGYAYTFDLPGDRIGEPMKFLKDPRRQTPIRDVRIEEDTVSTDEPDVWAVCKVEKEPAYWDLQFANCFSVALASQLAVPLTQDMDLAAEKYAMAFGSRSEGGTGGMFGRLVAQNRAASPISAPAYENDPLTEGRASATAWYGQW